MLQIGKSNSSGQAIFLDELLEDGEIDEDSFEVSIKNETQ